MQAEKQILITETIKNNTNNKNYIILYYKRLETM